MLSLDFPGLWSETSCGLKPARRFKLAALEASFPPFMVGVYSEISLPPKCMWSVCSVYSVGVMVILDILLNIVTWIQVNDLYCYCVFITCGIKGRY